MNKGKEALEDHIKRTIDYMDRKPHHYDEEEVLTYKEALKSIQQPDYKAMFEKMHLDILDLKDMYEDSLNDRLELPSTKFIIEILNGMITKYQAMKGSE